MEYIFLIFKNNELLRFLIKYLQVKYFLQLFFVFLIL
jgi:hypothetical protein